MRGSEVDVPRTKERSVGSVSWTKVAFSGSGSQSGATGGRTRAVVGEALCSASRRVIITWEHLTERNNTLKCSESQVYGYYPVKL